MTAMPVHPQIQQVIDALAASEFGPVHGLTPTEARAQYERMVQARGIEPDPVGAIEDRAIAGPSGALPVRIYRPDVDAEHLPALVYYHGGGHVIGNLDTHDAVARNLCNGAGCVVVSVDYRLAPEDKFPAAAEDAVAAVRWCAARGLDIGIDPRRIAVGGDSAGGNLAAVAALSVRDAGGPAIRPPGTRLPGHRLWVRHRVVPNLRRPATACSKRGRCAGSATTTCAARRTGSTWRAAPLRAADLSGLPPALVLTAQCDVLHDEGEAYAQRLREAGVDVEYMDYEGMIHRLLHHGADGRRRGAGAGAGVRRAEADVCASFLNVV